ncbi:hypothetical protein [Streptomyces lunaelactis]|uniref:hypothetical protein n=1 Tax=Streptomyces lunaelactis TaxID=1535768 RepID=UPI001585A868|nr:hypothetical protein [Streptomyces lunaelactis]NUL14557.1 hypothetical protein [Streptomyces lunaelactis]
MTDAATEIQAAARKRTRAKDAFDRADGELRDLLVKWRAEGVGPSEMARWTGFTREWVAKVAPDPKAAARKRVDPAAAHDRRQRGDNSES